MATKSVSSVTELNVKVNHLEKKFVQLNKRVSLLEVDRENHRKIPSTPKITCDESSASKNDSPLTRIGKDFMFNFFNCKRYFVRIFFLCIKIDYNFVFFFSFI